MPKIVPATFTQTDADGLGKGGVSIQILTSYIGSAFGIIFIRG